MFSLKSKRDDAVTAGLSITEKGIALAIVDHRSAKPLLQNAQFYSCSPPEQLERLTQLVKEHQLDEIPCNLVLPPDEYKLMQVDTPDVPKNELTAALRWKMNDLIDFHIDDAVMEHFELANSSASVKDSQMVVACRQSLIQNYVDILVAAHCNLASIDIAALAARNIISHTALTDIQTSIGLFSVWDDNPKINVLLNNDLHLDRSSNLSLDSVMAAIEDEFSSQEPLDSLALELQRTFDYYESHSRQPGVMHLCLLSNGTNMTGLDQSIQQRLGIDCLLVNIADFLTLDESIASKVPNECMMAIGGALRKEH